MGITPGQTGRQVSGGYFHRFYRFRFNSGLLTNQPNFQKYGIKDIYNLGRPI